MKNPDRNSNRSKKKETRNIDTTFPDLNKRFHKRNKRRELAKNHKPT